MHNSEAADSHPVPRKRPMLWVLDAHSMGNGKRLRVYTIVVFSFVRTFAP